jgi:hypothetical protein
MRESPQNEDYSSFIHEVSISVNVVGMILYFLLTFIGFSYENFSDFSLKEWWMYATMGGLAPLIVTTYFLWYLKRANENVMGMFVVTPVAIFIHYITMGIAVHADFLGEHTDATLIGAELFLAIGFIAIYDALIFRKARPRYKTKEHLTCKKNDETSS